MIKEIFPEGQAIIRYQPCTTALFNRTVDEIDKAGESFIGIIRIDEPDASYFLFFLRGDAYAAGCIKDGKPMPLSIKDFIKHISGTAPNRNLSFYKIDPVLLKGMLVFLQREPSIKAATDMINLENVLAQIKNEKTAAFVILKKSDMLSFFYFHSGELKMAHPADTSDIRAENPAAEDMLLYAYPADKTTVEAMVYRDIKTTEASDKSGIKQFLISDVMTGKQKEDVQPAHPAPSSEEPKPARVRIEITDGPQKGNKFNVPLPCTIGRRDADLRIRDMTVSKKHASIQASGKNVIFKDLDSTNGSMVNGKEVKETALSDGDVIQMGNTILKIQFIQN